MSRLLDRYVNETGIAVIGGVLTLLLAALLAFAIGRIIRHLMVRSPHIDRSAAPVVVRLTRIAIMFIAVLAVLDDVGVEITTVLAALGIFGFAIGLALRPSLANIFTGVALFTVKPYKTGDHIEAEKVEGVVENLGLFHTEIATRDGVYVSVPNDVIWAKAIRNLSRPRPWRSDLEITAPRRDDANAIRVIIMSTVAANGDVSTALPPSLRLTKLTEKTATYRLSISCEADRSFDLPRELVDEIKAALAAADLKPNSAKVLPREVPSTKAPAKKTKAAPAKAEPAAAAAAETATAEPAPESPDERERGALFGRSSQTRPPDGS